MNIEQNVLFVDTTLTGAKGSMARYAGLLENALQNVAETSHLWKTDKLCVSLPFRIPAWLPRGVATWLNHLWIVMTAARRIRRVKPDLVHVLDGSYGYLIPGIGELPVVATVHDLIPMLQQQGGFKTGKTSFLAKHVINRSIEGLKHCRQLIADSSSTADDLVAYTGVETEEITVVPLALGHEFMELVEKQSHEAPRSPSGLGPFVFHIGNNAWYKNRQAVVRIFSMMNRELKARLVMAGPPPSEDLKKLVSNLGLQHRVEFVINPDDARLFELYKSASLFLFPSIYEGFGWPPLEAMAFGCPVVCSSAASLPEVVGDAALMAAVEDEQALATHCTDVLQDRALARSLSDQGRLRAAQFTVGRMGRDITAVYENVLAAGSSTS